MEVKGYFVISSDERERFTKFRELGEFVEKLESPHQFEYIPYRNRLQVWTDNCLYVFWYIECRGVPLISKDTKSPRISPDEVYEVLRKEGLI